jgi:putative zinc finger/helix-turn-helix YgiT family protein
MTIFKELSSGEDICPVCETEREIKRGLKKETFIIKNEPIEFDAEVEFCPSCREYFADIEAEERNYQKAYRLYRDKHELLQPEDIKELREKYGLGQRAFSLLLGWGEITIHRYEAGALQDEIHNNELLLMKNPENLDLLFEKNKDRLSPRVRNRVKERLTNFLHDKKKNDFHKFLETFFYDASNDINSGFRWFDLERFENVILYFAETNSEIFKTKLLKLLWYFDFLTYKIFHKSATGAKYIHLPLGPVPNNYDIYLSYLVKENALLIDEISLDEERGITGEICRALDKPDLSIFLDNEKACLRKVNEHFKHFTASKISKCSHEEAGYKNTIQSQIISYEWAKELSLDL